MSRDTERWTMIRRRDWEHDHGHLMPPGAPVPTPDDQLEVFDVVRAPEPEPPRPQPTPDPRAQPFDGDDTLGVWVALCPVYGWDHAAVYNDPMADVNCPHCWRFWGVERPCALRHYDRSTSYPHMEEHTRQRAAAHIDP